MLEEADDDKASSSTIPSYTPKMTSVFRTYHEEKIDLKDIIVRDLLHLIAEINFTNHEWQRKKGVKRKVSDREKSIYRKQIVDIWEMAELIKAILRFFGVE